MNVSDTTWSVLTGVLVVALVYMLVRPGSKAATAVTAVSSAMVALVGNVTGFVSPAPKKAPGQQGSQQSGGQG